ncbi:hypothetical protein C7E18_00340 [Stenotrophomonas maltophilia]|nr:hypothetical protein C7E18_00340 [Stenotrophomonas maltophilia]
MPDDPNTPPLPSPHCQTELAAHRGYLKAMEYGLRALIIAHPAADRLSQVWERMLPGIVDAHASEDEPMFSAAFQQLLTLLGEQIQQGSQPP